MTAKLLIPAAQYLRMSTDHQQYSLDSQRLAIHSYADATVSPWFGPIQTQPRVVEFSSAGTLSHAYALIGY